jgi:hypothetical protein
MSDLDSVPVFEDLIEGMSIQDLLEILLNEPHQEMLNKIIRTFAFIKRAKDQNE